MFTRVKTAHENNRTHKRSYQFLPYLLILIGLSAGALAITLHMRQVHAVPPPLPQIVAPTETTTPAPIAKPSPKMVANYSVASALPKYLSIPAIGINKVRILTLGIGKDNEIAVPTSSYDTGWYKNSAKPGQTGAMFIYGHVAGWNAGGVFYNLKKLKPGDKVLVTRGDNAIYTYQVDSLKTYSASSVNMNTVLSPINPTKSGLNLMTCVWTIDHGKSEFDSRQVVFTSLVNPT